MHRFCTALKDPSAPGLDMGPLKFLPKYEFLRVFEVERKG